MCHGGGPNGPMDDRFEASIEISKIPVVDDIKTVQSARAVINRNVATVELE